MSVSVSHVIVESAGKPTRLALVSWYVGPLHPCSSRHCQKVAFSPALLDVRSNNFHQLSPVAAEKVHLLVVWQW